MVSCIYYYIFAVINENSNNEELFIKNKCESLYI